MRYASAKYENGVEAVKTKVWEVWMEVNGGRCV